MERTVYGILCIQNINNSAASVAYRMGTCVYAVWDWNVYARDTTIIVIL